MPLNIKNKPQLTGIIILFVGVALLAFTFINAYLFLQVPLSIIASGDLARVFGQALAPLIQACIHLMYLGIMGWIGSLLTVRGIPLVTHRYISIAKTVRTAQPRPQTKRARKQVLPEPKTQLTPEPKLGEPQAILIPPQNQGEE